MRRLAQCALVAVLGVGAAGRLSAQVVGVGIPDYVNPSGGTGILAAANFGMITSPDGQKGKAIALAGGMGLGPLFVTASVGQYNPDLAGASNLTTYGATAGMKLFGGPLVPVTIGAQAGVGYWSQSGASMTRIPVAAAIGLSIPLFPLKPWIAPRVEFDRMAATGASTVNLVRPGFSIGTDFNLLLGLGLHVAYDQVFKTTKNGTPYPSVSTIGVGAHFRFSVPMM